MENASKALIMAGGILIALMIIGALLLMFNNLSSYEETNTETTREAQVITFNNQYETYNREKVRGSDLYTLLNKVIDYNERKSAQGVEGKEIAYEPITIVFEFDGKVDTLSVDGTNTLITQNSYTQSNTENIFKNVITEIRNLEGKIIPAGTGQIKFSSMLLTNLCTAYTKVFLDTSDNNEKIKALQNFNSIYGENIFDINTSSPSGIVITVKQWNMYLAQNKEVRKIVNKYYEYVQFKRAYFDCLNIQYNNKTGRIIKMEFKFNGKFQ